MELFYICIIHKQLSPTTLYSKPRMRAYLYILFLTGLTELYLHIIFV